MSWSLLYLASEWAVRFVMLVYVPQKRSATASRAWLLLIFLLPWPGLLIYAFFGRAYLPRRRLERQRLLDLHLGEKRESLREILGPAEDLSTAVRPLTVLGEDLGGFRPLGGNSVELLPDYSDAIDHLVADIEASTGTAHLLFYIFEDDGTGRRVAEALIRAAERGVTCRVMMDALGSKRGLKALGPTLRAAGVEVVPAMPVGLFRRHTARYDLRNHRKIAILDGKVGYAGSQNIVDGLFVKGYPNEELWARVEGPVVLQLQAVFLSDYFCETGGFFDGPACFPLAPSPGASACQVVPSGPSYQRQNGQELIVEMLYRARERLCITTPYFIPDDAFLEALRTAARRGAEVRLVLSMHANQLLSQLAQRAYYDDLLEVGIHIHLYEPRFLHAKHITVDSEIALVGSTNMDIRSFALNEEINLLVYDPEVVARIRAIQERYLANSEELALAAWRARSGWAKVAHNTARLLDSLL